MNETYSVLMSVYAKENPAWFRESLDSMLGQTIPPAEIVIVEDGPLTAPLLQVIAEYKNMEPDKIVEVPLQENRGLGIALAKGVENCRYEQILRMDTDDISLPQRAQRQLEAMQNHHADLVSCNLGEFEENPSRILKYKNVPETQKEILQYAKRRNPFNHPAVAFKRSSVLSAGNYQDCRWIEDYDLWIRMLQNGCTGYNVQEPLLAMRVNRDTYRRRGGMPYLRSMLAFNRKWKKAHWFSGMDCLVRSGASIVMTLMPNGLRDRMYKKALRKEK